MNSKKQHQFAELVLSALQGDISEEQSRTLQNILNRDPDALSLYADLMEIYVELSPLGNVRIPSISESQANNQIETFNELLNLLANDERTASIIDIPKPAEPKPALESVQKTIQVRRKVSKFDLWVIGLSMAAMLFIVTYVKILPSFQTVPVATITDSMRAEYDNEEFPIGSRLTNREDMYFLTKGVAQIEFDSGASVVIEAPAEFQLKSTNKMALHSGRLFAVVPGQATGFAVKTAKATVVDLGTEFALDVTASRGTELYVLSGKTNLRVSMRKQALVTTGQARCVDATEAIGVIPFEKYRFIRRIDSKANMISRGRDMVSLTDLVIGGNGYGTSQTASETYSVDTGQKTPLRKGEYQAMDNTYQKVVSNPFIDGLFVPNGRDQIVSSEEHIFANCPETSGLYFFDLCIDKSWRFAPPAAQLYRKQRNLNFAPNLMFMHSNLGVTFDMDAVRRQFPDHSIRRFLGSVGVMFAFGGSPIKEAQEISPGNTEFDVQIVIDGQLRFKSEKVRWDDLINLDVPVMEGDRFLSILITDGGVIYEGENANHYDSCGLADLRFEIESIE